MQSGQECPGPDIEGPSLCSACSKSGFIEPCWLDLLFAQSLLVHDPRLRVPGENASKVGRLNLGGSIIRICRFWCPYCLAQAPYFVLNPRGLRLMGGMRTCHASPGVVGVYEPLPLLPSRCGPMAPNGSMLLESSPVLCRFRSTPLLPAD